MDEVQQRLHLFVMEVNCVCKIIESFHMLGLIINGLRSNKHIVKSHTQSEDATGIIKSYSITGLHVS